MVAEVRRLLDPRQRGPCQGRQALKEKRKPQVKGRQKATDAGDGIQNVSVILLRLGGRSGSNPHTRAVCSIIR
jgi:hypothetical protein